MTYPGHVTSAPMPNAMFPGESAFKHYQAVLRANAIHVTTPERPVTIRLTDSKITENQRRAVGNLLAGFLTDWELARFRFETSEDGQPGVPLDVAAIVAAREQRELPMSGLARLIVIPCDVELSGDELVEWVIAEKRAGRQPIGLPGGYTTAVTRWSLRNPDRIEELIDMDGPSFCNFPFDGLIS